LNAEASVTRVYNTEYAAHILGYLGAMNPSQWDYYKTLTYEYTKLDGTVGVRNLYSMDALVGQEGLEAAFEEYLHGVDGVRVDVTYVDGTIKESYYVVEPKAGQNVMLTVDMRLQETAEKSLASLIEKLRANGGDGADAEGGAVVVMNVKTGEILASASYPTFNLSTFRQDYNQLLTTPYAPLYNRALQATYPPGSTYKMSTLIAGIDSGVIGMYEEVFDGGIYKEYIHTGFAPQCLQYTNYGYGHGWTNSLKALQRSCNFYFYHVGDKLTIDAMDATAKALGLGEKTGVELYERPGYRANPTTKEQLYSGSQVWSPADKVLSAIGQADNRFTPAQLCVYTSTLANRGVRYKATFLTRVLSADYSKVVYENEVEQLGSFNISDEAYAAYTQGMRLAAQSGTAAGYFGNYPIAVAAKTGTAEAGGGSDNAAFVCYAPYDDPQIAVTVYIEKGGHGSTAAAVARNILDAYFYDALHGNGFVGENQIG
jgi:penicillin-binding protein 2